MNVFSCTLLLFLLVNLITTDESVNKKIKEKFSIHSLFRYTVRNDNVEEFLSIRYAAVENNMRKAIFSEINDSTSLDLQHRFFQHGPPFCLQARNPKIHYTDRNCLFLNIWTPRGSENKNLPVVVWLVGGLFKEGGSNLDKYRAYSFANKTNSVLVVVQYRIGPSGFFYLDNEYALGNNGLKDQVLALKWVNRYIELFRGNHKNIVLVGDEAGAVSVGYHLLSSKNSKLFKSAVMLDGVPITEWAFMDKIEAYNRSSQVKERLQCNEQLDCMKEYVSEEGCKRDWEVVPEEGPIKIPFFPTQESKVVPDHPLKLLHRAKHLRGKTIMIGNTKEAGMKFVNQSIVYHDHFKNALLPNLGNNITIFQKFNLFYKNISSVKYYHKILSDIYTDRYFRCPADEFVRVARKHGATVYQYEMHSADELKEEIKYFLFQTDNFKPSDFTILQKSGIQLSGFIHNGYPSSIMNKGWGREVFYIGPNDAKATESKQRCDFIKETLHDYLPSHGSRAEPFKILLSIVFIATLVVIRSSS